MKTNLKTIAEDIAQIKIAILTKKTVLTPKEAAQYIGVSLSTLYKLTSAGIIPFSKPNGKLIYFSKEELDKWLLSNPSKSDSDTETQASTFLTINLKK